MTPQRLAKIRWLIDGATSARELAGLRWGFKQQNEFTESVQVLIQDRAIAKGWWPLPRYGE